VYLAAVFVETAIRAPLRRQLRANKIAEDRVSGLERLLVGFLFVGIVFAPVAYIFTPWLAFANYRLPDWAGWLGVALMLAALWVFWRAHADLGLNWSPSLQIREGHDLITHGIYRVIRHPMYASAWLWGIAQILLLQNWIAGFAGLVTFMPMYFLRVPREEQMMLDTFGESYRAYMGRTGRVLPLLRQKAD
jgi:protein-S-isoprenylcysteine O-methyltransferase Ste14